MKSLLGYDTECHFIWEVKNFWSEIFPEVPSKSLFNRRLRKLNEDMEMTSFYQKLLLCYKELLSSDKRIIDTQPVIFKKAARKNTVNTRIEGMDLGYCASLKEYYFGYKLHLLVTPEGFPSRFALSPASTHDSKKVMGLTYGLKDIKLIGDKGYIDQKGKTRLKELRNIEKITPYKRNMKLQLTKEEKECLKLRGQIEKDFSAMEVLKVKRCRAKSTGGTLARIMTGLLALTLVMITNWELYGKVSVSFCPYFT